MVRLPYFCMASASLIITHVLADRCESDEDCNLNGVCLTHHTHGFAAPGCICDSGWRGADCGELDVRPTSRDSGYNRTAEGISSWGSKIVRDPNQQDLHHLFLAEFTKGCGLDYWSPYSRIIRAESRAGPAGPYNFAAEVVGTFSHNPTVIYSAADEKYLLYYIGCPQRVNDTCTGPHFTCGPGNFINGESGISLQSSTDLLNWKPQGQVFKGFNNADWDADTTNPSPLSLDMHGHRQSSNSEILLAYRGCPYNCSGEELISLALAPHYTGPYTRLDDHEPLFAAPNEDPFIWQDRRGNFHVLLHSLEPDGGFGDGPKVGRHAYARQYQGPWTFNKKTLAFNTTITFDDGTSIDFYRRERPQLFFSDDYEMRPQYLTTGVQQMNSSMSYTAIVPLGRKENTKVW